MDALSVIALGLAGSGGGSGGDVTKQYVDEHLALKADKTETAEYPIADTTTGTNPTITDSADGLVQDITVYGRTDTVEGELRGIGEDGELEITTANSDNTASTTATVTTGIPLYAVGDVKDELSEKRGVIVKRCEKTTEQGEEVIVPLATPVEIPLTSAELSALRGLKTYSSTTNVTVTDSPTVDIGYLLNTDNGQAVADVQQGLQKQIDDSVTFDYYVKNQGKINSILNHTYEGEALTDLFANEIQADYDNPWQWITARTAANNFNGINVADFIPITIKTYNLNAQIAGIKTYTGYGDTAVGKHIDWISKELYPETHAVNKINFNNGTAAQNHPWLASDLYHWLNSLSGTVPNEAVVGGGAGEAVDYTADGVYYNLPAELKSAIIEKRRLLPSRYSASELLLDDGGIGWTNMGKLWIPDECEVYGMPIWGGKRGSSLSGSGLQYPLFAGNMNRLKFSNNSRATWWLLSPISGNFAQWCIISANGDCYYYDTSASGIAIKVPVCFRTGETYLA